MKCILILSSLLVLATTLVAEDCVHMGIRIPVGESRPGPLGDCSIWKCHEEDTGHMSVSGLTCPEFVPRQGCKVGPYDYTKQYPDCCPVSVC